MVFKKVDTKDNRIIKAIIKSVRVALLKRSTGHASHKFLGHSHSTVRDHHTKMLVQFF